MDLDQLERSIEKREKWEKENPIKARIQKLGWFLQYRLWDLPGDWKREVKWAYQRVKRGYDDPYIWNFHHINAQQTLEVLKWMKKNRMGSPLVLEDEWNESQDKEWSDRNHKAWEDILDKMIAGFEALIAKDDVFIQINGKYDSEATRKELDRLDAIWKEGSQLFIKHYEALWD